MLKRTHLRIVIMLAACVVLGVPARASEIGEEIVAQIREESYRYFIDMQLFTRVGDDRGYDAPQHDLARDNIAAIFESFGLAVELHAFEWNGAMYYNVVATQVGMAYPDGQYIVGAHYDSVSNPGADDNASGVSALLEVARVLSAYEAGYTIKYIAFDLEESGLLGSEAYVADHLTDDIRGMISADMIAHDAGNYTVLIHGRTTSASVKQALQAAINEYGDGVVALRRSALDYSDHAPFEWAGFAACVLIEDQYSSNPCYHCPCDSVDMRGGYINYVFATNVTRGVAGYLADNALAYHPYDCDADGTADESQIAGDPGLDCNGNGILDVCEFSGDQDINGNGVPDLCDIHAGTSDDCNGNWIPDETESGYGLDCNGNGTPDFCDLIMHESEDFNANGTPDECEIHGTIYVDDDAPNDPGPGDPNSSDPLESGSDEHPFDGIAEAVALSVSGDRILVRPGLYVGPANRSISFGGRQLELLGEGGAEACVIDIQGSGRAFSIALGQGHETVVEGFRIQNGSSSGGTAFYLYAASPLIRNCVFEGNTATYYGGSIRSSYGGPIIAECVFSNNSAGRGGGAVRFFDSVATVVNCVFVQNAVFDGSYPIGGGAAHCIESAVIFNNCLFWENEALPESTDGGALYLSSDEGTALRQCSFGGNQASDTGGVLFWGGAIWDDRAATMADCVLWGNQAPQGAQLALSGVGTFRVSHSDVAGGSGGVPIASDAILEWGSGNIDADPMFVDPNSGDLHLLAGSPCIDAGANALVPADYADLDGDGDVYELTPLDLDYEGRFFDDPNAPDSGCGTAPIVDMGAYEFGGTGPQPCTGDFDGDGNVDLSDLAELLGSYGSDDGGDLDCDGDTDLHDLWGLLAAYGDECS